MAAYGVWLFALWGMSVIPEAAEIAPRRKLGEAVVVSILVSFLASVLFILIVLA